MDKEKKNYIIVWVLLMALFQFICFITPAEMNGVSKFTASFWIAYGFVTGSFLIHLLFSFSIMKAESQDKKAITTSLMTISWIELMLMMAAGGAAMIIPGIPYWAGAILCAVTLVFSILFVLIARSAGENEVKANRTLNAKTETMRLLADEAESLIGKAKTEDSGKIVKKVYEALRYSDPISNDVLLEDEKEISGNLQKLALCMSEGREIGEIQSIADELLTLIENRNRKCKTMKRSK